MPSYKYRSTVTAKWDVLKRLVGRIVGKDVVQVEGEDREFIIVDAGHSIYRVFHAAGLDDVFTKGEKGDYVDIAPLPKVELKGGRSFRPFKVSLFTLAEGESLSSVVGDEPPTAIPATQESSKALTGTEGVFHAKNEDVPF